MELRTHQQQAISKAWGKEAFAYLMEQGSGKTATILVEAQRLFLAGEINALLVFAPNAVHRNWLLEAEKFLSVTYKAFAWSASLTKSETKELVALFNSPQDTLKIYTVNIEGMSASKAIAASNAFASSTSCMAVVDESTRIKNITAKRTKHIIDVGALAKYRRIATGTPITNSPLDLFAQFAFLDERIIGAKNFFMFKARYAVTKDITVRVKRGSSLIERRVKKVVGAKNVDELYAKIEPYSFIVRKEDCLDLPPKVYQTRDITLGKEQQRMYDSLRDNMITAVGDEDMTVTSALSMLLRLQQIAGGFATDDTGNVTPIKDNKGIAELVSLVDEIDGCVIIWARFRAELAAIADALRVAYPDDTTVEYHGGVSDTDKDEAVRLVQEGKARFFVANQQSGGTGLTLTKATTSIYYSQTFSLEDRLQSEDRNHRIGTDSTVTYITFVRRGTIDEKINEAFKHKKAFLDVFRKEVEGGSLWA